LAFSDWLLAISKITAYCCVIFEPRRHKEFLPFLGGLAALGGSKQW
jgi:hypothetical protein